MSDDSMQQPAPEPIAEPVIDMQGAYPEEDGFADDGYQSRSPVTGY